MQAIIIGAGRGQRLMPTTADTPKCFAEVGGKRLLDWALEALRANGIDRICFIGGYRIDRVREAYPELTFRHNEDWQNNNILASLFHAEDLMTGPFLCAYSDILFTPEVVRKALASTEDMALIVDTHWRQRYTDRTGHPPDDAEKVLVQNGQVTRVSRDIDTERAHGEYIGVARFSAAGAALLKAHYRRCRDAYAGKPFHQARLFEKAYLIQLYQDMIEAGERFAHVDTPGEYIEIDTQQDFDYARRHWTGASARSSDERVATCYFPPRSSVPSRARTWSRT
jgi:L-glutamine-phosphate cytidylyltransferase